MCRYKRGSRLVRGFTLVELLISLGIIVMITSIVMVKFSAFDSTTLLKGAAYEVALALRDAQVYSISVRGVGTTFDYPYGIHFDMSNQTTYTFFRDTNTANYPTLANPPDAVITALTTRHPAQIVDICTTKPGGDDCTINWLDISFRRPEFSALFRDSNGDTTTISKAKIKLQSSKNPGDIWVVEVGLLGHISVVKQ